MRAFLSLVFVLALTAGGFAADIKKGAAMQVKANSIWFSDAAELAQWQQLKKAGDASTLAAYEEKILRSRDAWQFINPLKVKVLGYNAAKQRVYVEMTNEGRMQGTDWLLDPDVLLPQ
jgi:hypothetical protein